MLAALLLASLLASDLVVEGESTCPSPDGVRQALAAHRHGEETGADAPQKSVISESPARESPAAGGRRARISRQGPLLRIELLAPDGALLADRELEADQLGCDSLARAAALVILTLGRNLSSGTPLPLPVEVSGHPGAGPEAARAGGEPASRGRSLSYDVGASFVASLGATPSDSRPTAFAPGGVLEAHLAGAAGLGGRLAFTGTALRSERLGAGNAGWTRFAFSVGPFYRLIGARSSLRSRVLLDVHLDALLAATYIGGLGYDSDRSSVTFDPGVGAGLRLGLRLGRALPFVGLTVVGWPREQRVTVVGVGQQARLGQLELFLTGGIAFGAAEK